ncbi:MAG TPA: DUF1549 and DUF1553 domain-containing protein [Planctomycetaceae bacterium]|jgi:hypothetical protein|nr:DUF1549 and DUF1553 domain-containing protein [Planctomycetaceae bacterium]
MNGMRNYRWLGCAVALAAGAISADFSRPLRAADPVKDPYDLSQYDRVIEAADRDHWAYRPVARPPVPRVKQSQWCANPIDCFILSRLETAGWTPNSTAEPRALLRRVFLDVVGLPPSPADQQTFLADSSSGAWSRLVDRLLDDPGYGERWGRHWLDLVRYAESNGYERDAAKPSVWRYRDWVIDSLNSDKPYDRFVLEQLAGDELPDATAETIIATGFNRLGPWDDEPADPAEDRFDQLDDLVRTTSQAFLGLTLGCARCHNHKFDALTQHDYYRLVAVFSPLQRPSNGRGDLDLPAARTRAPAGSGAVAQASLGVPRGYFLYEPPTKVPTQLPVTHLLLRGRASAPGPIVDAGVPAVLAARQPIFEHVDGRTSRRRISFARWLVDERNPLVARVIVNRIWQQHFGQGIVRTASDFGVQGAAPSHPELLDWLANWFVHDARWSMKKLHRLILTSSTYRMSKQSRPDYAAKDPANERFWRFPYHRLEVEAIRDSMLTASGELRRTMHGPSVHLAIPKEAVEANSDPQTIWPAFNEDEAARRTVYAFVKRSLVVPMLEVLDLCDTTRSAERRNITSVPTQALTLLNGDESNRQARHLAQRLVREAGPDRTRQIERAFELTICRRPSADESRDLLAFLERESRHSQTAPHQTASSDVAAASERRALELVCRAIFNLNEFVYPD